MEQTKEWVEVVHCAYPFRMTYATNDEIVAEITESKDGNDYVVIANGSMYFLDTEDEAVKFAEQICQNYLGECEFER